MRLASCKKIFEYLLEKGDEGRSIEAIAEALTLSTVEVEACVSKLSDSFELVADTDCYRIRQDTGVTVKSMEKEYKQKVDRKSGSLFVLLIIIVSLITVFSQTK